MFGPPRAALAPAAEVELVEPAADGDDDDFESDGDALVRAEAAAAPGRTAAAPGGAAPAKTRCAKCSAFYWENEFVLNVVLAIAFARAFPVIGINLAPEYSKIVCVAVIFFFTGLGLRTRELLRALADYKFNLFVQSFNLGIVTVAVWLVSLGLAQSGMNKDLADGITICGALPMTVNMVIVLTKSAGGDEAAAVFNSALGNLMGVFVTPLWVVALLGKAAAFSFADVLAALAVRVLLPLAVGQFTQYQLPRAAAWAKTKKPQLKRLQEVLLTFVVYVVFCGTFHDGVNASAGDVAIMFVVMPALILATMALAWVSLGIAFPAQPALRVMGLFGCTHKTIAMGVPLIDAIFASQRFDSRRAFFLLPLLVWHPAQLIIGSAMTGKLSRWVTSEKERLGIIDDDAEPAPAATKAPATKAPTKQKHAPESRALNEQREERV